MLWTVAIILIVLWLLGIVTANIRNPFVYEGVEQMAKRVVNEKITREFRQPLTLRRRANLQLLLLRLSNKLYSQKAR